MSEYKITDGVLNFLAGDREYKMIVTINAAIDLSNKYGGLFAAYEKVRTCNVMDIFAVIEAGIGTKLHDDERDFIFSNIGAAELMPIAGSYLDLLFRGGKAEADDEANKTGKQKAKQ